MKNPRHFAAASLIAIVLGAATFGPGAAYADSLLTGAVTSAAGEKMGGVTGERVRLLFPDFPFRLL